MREVRDVLPEGRLLIRGVQLPAQQPDVLGRGADKVYGVEMRLHGAGALDAVEEKHPARDGVRRHNYAAAALEVGIRE